MKNTEIIALVIALLCFVCCAGGLYTCGLQVCMTSWPFLALLIIGFGSFFVFLNKMMGL